METQMTEQKAASPATELVSKRTARTRLYAWVQTEGTTELYVAESYAELKKTLSGPEVKQVLQVIRGYPIKFTEHKTVKFF